MCLYYTCAPTPVTTRALLLCNRVDNKLVVIIVCTEKHHCHCQTLCSWRIINIDMVGGQQGLLLCSSRCLKLLLPAELMSMLFIPDIATCCIINRPCYGSSCSTIIIISYCKVIDKSKAISSNSHNNQKKKTTTTTPLIKAS